MRLYLFSLISINFFILSHECIAQDDLVKNFIDRKSKWEIGYSPLYWINQSSQPSPYALILKNYKYGLKSVSALRFKVSVDGNKILSQSISGSNITGNFARSNRSNLKLFVGKEWNNLFNKIVFFYGYDVMFNHLNENINGYNQSGILSTNTKTEQLEIGLSPFAGSKYLISSRFSIAIETNFLISYNTGSTKNKININTTQVNEVENNIRYISYSFNPVGFLYLSFHF